MFDALDKMFGVIAALGSVVAAIVALKVYLLIRQEHDRQEKLREAPMAPALKLLLDAHAQGEQPGKGRWDFAVENGTLRSAGLTNVDFRWLVSEGYVEHVEELPSSGSDGRAFQRVGEGSFTDAACFILTDGGVAYAKEVLETASQGND